MLSEHAVVKNFYPSTITLKSSQPQIFHRFILRDAVLKLVGIASSPCPFNYNLAMTEREGLSQPTDHFIDELYYGDEKFLVSMDIGTNFSQ